ncbi:TRANSCRIPTION INITIATION FACTOR TFIID 20/15kDa SUBUNIT [Encephalitozoon cuniculi GB-M1]|uniref:TRANSCRIPTION INITIATION FACTOR TFIID 20/15kDa SUBUNIT n=2 Tax=Encephalitozoon cuniculi TaxID=6035 RepID=Q8SSD3_ENCCU|nr:transcription initiation factor TFIID subunit A [Encephalitozoon cuniculi GB-M1]AGE95639.1 transcription initiation factor TFIId20/15kDa subunit [Encephalitozoon cuniculi]KMV66668.1 transcription initiation factor TFIID subunit A [Encephalitozoon cuniculi EcunIII-L]UYI28345.1 putative transcription initiation factor TFIID subunit [Encephalitozoon cuniculi]CAD25179.1 TRANSCRIPTION INITIATION FACTOR TFIID 20/15kDa SUBUNIT [Encephalitozoon cuniculi GB-M1]
MSIEHHFLCPKKLLKLCNKKIDKDVIRNLQLLTEKFLSDIIHRSALLCKHKGKSTVDNTDIRFVIEKDFDYSFGTREIQGTTSLPTAEHLERMAEISRQNK